MPIHVFNRNVAIVPNGGNVRVRQKQKAEIGKDRFRQIHHDVARRVPRQEDTGFGAAHRFDRAIQKADSWMPAAWIRSNDQTAFGPRFGCRRIFDFRFRFAAHQRCLGACIVMRAHVGDPERQIGARGFYFHW